MKLRKVGYSSGLSVRIGRVPDGDIYPRWGYSGRLENNIVMPRAFVASAVLFLSLTGAWSGWKAFRAWQTSQRVEDFAQRSNRRIRVQPGSTVAENEINAIRPAQ